jgi:hypothetical protein
MSRIRTVKPEFWKHEELSALPESVHILAAALLNYADDEGYFNANHKLVKAECCPLRETSVSVHDALAMLSGIGYLRLGSGADGKRYGHIVKFDSHQRVNRKTPSKIKTIEIAWEPSVMAHPQLTEPSPLEGKGKERNGKEDAAPGARTPVDAEKELFARGKEVLGKDAGGLVVRLRKSKGGSIELARAAIELAPTKENPRE